jgi:hypothetical protein
MSIKDGEGLRLARGVEQAVAHWQKKPEETQGEEALGRYEVYVVSPHLRGELGIALMDSGSQVSLVKEASLGRCKYEKNQVVIQGVTGNQLKVKGKVDIHTGNTLEPLKQECFVVEQLPRNLDLILGQDWLENNGYSIQKKTPVVIPPYSEQFVRCGTKERGIRYIEHQTLQPGLICASSSVNCEDSIFPSLVVNLTEEPIVMTINPKLENPLQC